MSTTVYVLFLDRNPNEDVSVELLIQQLPAVAGRSTATSVIWPEYEAVQQEYLHFGIENILIHYYYQHRKLCHNHHHNHYDSYYHHFHYYCHYYHHFHQPCIATIVAM